MSAFWNLYSDKILPEPNSGCWFWMGGLSERDYGVIYPERGRNVRAHRVAYEMTRGPIPVGLVLDHLCRIHCCVNPDHLEAVTQLVNVRRGARCALRLRLPSKRPPEGTSENKRAYARLYRQSSAGKEAKRRELDKRKHRRAEEIHFQPEPSTGSKHG